MSETPKTEEDRIAETVANGIICINTAIQLHEITVPYLQDAAQHFRDKASRNESAFLLNPSYPSQHIEMLRASGAALEHLAKFIEANERVAHLREQLKKAEAHRQAMNKSFMYNPDMI